MEANDVNIFFIPCYSKIWYGCFVGVWVSECFFHLFMEIFCLISSLFWTCFPALTFQYTCIWMNSEHTEHAREASHPTKYNILRPMVNFVINLGIIYMKFRSYQIYFPLSPRCILLTSLWSNIQPSVLCFPLDTSNLKSFSKVVHSFVPENILSYMIVGDVCYTLWAGRNGHSRFKRCDQVRTKKRHTLNQRIFKRINVL